MEDELGNAGRPSTSKWHAGSVHHPLFSPFRALGLISEGGTPFAMQRRGRETFVATSVGTSWQVRSIRSSDSLLNFSHDRISAQERCAAARVLTSAPLAVDLQRAIFAVASDRARRDPRAPPVVGWAGWAGGRAADIGAGGQGRPDVRGCGSQRGGVQARASDGGVQRGRWGGTGHFVLGVGHHATHGAGVAAGRSQRARGVRVEYRVVRRAGAGDAGQGRRPNVPTHVHGAPPDVPEQGAGGVVGWANETDKYRDVEDSVRVCVVGIVRGDDCAVAGTGRGGGGAPGWACLAA